MIEIRLFEKPASGNILFSTFLKNVVIDISDYTLDLKADEVIYKFTYNRIYVEDMDVRPKESSIERTLFKHREYVEGWYNTNQTEPYHIITNTYLIKYE